MNKNMLMLIARQAAQLVPEVKQYLKPETITALKGGDGSGNFGHAGRPGEVGGSAPNGGGDYNQRIRNERVTSANQRIKEVANKLGVSSERIIYDDSHNEKEWGEVAGNYDAETDIITIYQAAFYSDAQDGIIAHELMHRQIHSIGQEEMDAIEAELVDKYGNFSFEENDGVTPYSEHHWSEYSQSSSLSISRYNLAMHETLCEIARLSIYGNTENVHPAWLEFYERVKNK